MLRSLSILLLLASTAHADATDTPDSKTVGIGYKAGNGIGFFGADVIVNPTAHLGLDLHAAVFPVTGNGENALIYAVAPAVQGYLFGGQRSTPYASVGIVYAHLTLGGATASVLGTFVNLGYEWRWSSGLGVQLGGGISYINKAEATDGQSMVSFGGNINPNIEIGVGYMFF
jgi:hypothetical protein